MRYTAAVMPDPSGSWGPHAPQVPGRQPPGSVISEASCSLFRLAERISLKSLGKAVQVRMDVSAYLRTNCVRLSITGLFSTFGTPFERPAAASEQQGRGIEQITQADDAAERTGSNRPPAIDAMIVNVRNPRTRPISRSTRDCSALGTADFLYC